MCDFRFQTLDGKHGCLGAWYPFPPPPLHQQFLIAHAECIPARFTPRAYSVCSEAYEQGQSLTKAMGCPPETQPTGNLASMSSALDTPSNSVRCTAPQPGCLRPRPAPHIVLCVQSASGALDCLRSKPEEEVQEKLPHRRGLMIHTGVRWFPVVDGTFEPEHPMDLIRKGQVLPVGTARDAPPSDAYCPTLTHLAVPPPPLSRWMC
jgi:hypothetical protein